MIAFYNFFSFNCLKGKFASVFAHKSKSPASIKLGNFIWPRFPTFVLLVFFSNFSVDDGPLRYVSILVFI